MAQKKNLTEMKLAHENYETRKRRQKPFFSRSPVLHDKTEGLLLQAERDFHNINP